MNKNPTVLLSRFSTFFLQCDIQEKFRKSIYRMNSVIHTAKLLNKAANHLQIPLFVSEQIPKSLGKTLPELPPTYPNSTTIFSKTKMSMYPDLCLITTFPKKSSFFVLYGIEAHICILQTALQLREAGHEVFIVTDGVSSSRALDRSTGIKRMEAAGCRLNTYEGVIMELIRDAGDELFKGLLPLLKEKRPDDMLDSL